MIVNARQSEATIRGSVLASKVQVHWFDPPFRDCSGENRRSERGRMRTHLEFQIQQTLALDFAPLLS